MARMKSLVPLLIFSVLVSFSTEIDGSAGGGKKKKMGMREKLTKFSVYWQDLVSGPHPTSVMLIPPPSNSSSSVTGFGLTRVIDNALTVGPERNSTVVGRAQGLYMSAQQSPPITLLMAMNFCFTSGKFNGSSITLMGANPVFSKVRELPVLSGTGVFRFARGYAHLTTHDFDLNSGDATVKYSIFVLHY